MKTLSIPELEAFHANFQGETEHTKSICDTCQDLCCGDTLIIPLLPGETEFIASKLKASVDQIRQTSLDGVLLDGLQIDVLRFRPECPFLMKHSGCTISAYKPVLCELYPLFFVPAEPQWRLVLDPSCLLSRTPSMQSHFESHGLIVNQQFPAIAQWHQRLYRILLPEFNFRAMLNDRDVPLDQYKLYQLDDLLAYSYMTPGLSDTWADRSLEP